MPKFSIIWEGGASDDLNGIWEYLAKDSIRNADKIGEAILLSPYKLALNPFIGQEEDILKRYKFGHRYILYSHYKVIYRIFEDKVFIAAVFDTRQKPTKLKKIVKKRK